MADSHKFAGYAHGGGRLSRPDVADTRGCSIKESTADVANCRASIVSRTRRSGTEGRPTIHEPWALAKSAKLVAAALRVYRQG
jgi:hypothetical protein